MQRQQQFCFECGARNPRTSHWHIGNRRFCSGSCYRAFADRDIGDRSNGHALDRWPGTFYHGVSPRPRT